MSKYSILIGSLKVNMSFTRDEIAYKTLTLSFPDYHIEAAMTYLPPNKVKMDLKYVGKNIPISGDGFELTEGLFSSSEFPSMYLWIEDGNPAKPDWNEMSDEDSQDDIRTILRKCAFAVSKYKNFMVFDAPLVDDDMGYVACELFLEQQAVVCHYRRAELVVVRFLGLNTAIAVGLGNENGDAAESQQPDKLFIDGGKRAVDTTNVNYQAFLKELSDLYSEPESPAKVDVANWIYDMYEYISAFATETECETSVPAAQDPETEPVDEIEVFRKLKAMFYAQNTPVFFEEYLQSIPDDERQHILAGLNDKIEQTRQNIRPGDIVMYEHGGIHVVVSCDSETVYTLKRRCGEVRTDSFPISKAFPTGRRFESWEDIEEMLAAEL